MEFPPVDDGLFPFDGETVTREYLSAEQYQRACDLIWSTDRRAAIEGTKGPVPPGGVIYAKTDHYLPLFQVLRRRRSRVVLVTAESDFSVPPEGAGFRPPQIASWFSTNAGAKDIHPLPLGLGNSYCQVTLKAPMLARSMKPNEDRPSWLYVNFRRESNPVARSPLLDHFHHHGQGWATVREGGAGLDEFLREMTAHRFVLCPPGNGTDTHRMWEALYGKTIPVVLRHKALSAFEDLPILFVEDFAEVTREFLEQAWQKIRATRWNYDKLFLPWWEKTILAAATDLRKAGPTRISPLRYFSERFRGW